MIENTLIIPVYRNAPNIPALLEALHGLHAILDRNLEVIFVIDGSPDNSGDLLQQAIGTIPCRARIIYHSRNFGAFAAIRTGMQAASGAYVAVMAADLQEPPELVISIFGALKRGEADVVFGKREKRHDGALSDFASQLFWGLYKRFVFPDIPSGGVDIFGCNRAVLSTVLKIEEPSGSLISQLFWVGFRRAYIPYERRERQVGKSGWSFRKRFQYMLDSIFGYTDLPIIVVLWAGVIGCSASVILGIYTAIARLTGHIDESGYTTLVILILFFGSSILAAQGLLGCYIWRISENSKRRPLSVIDEKLNVLKE